MYEFLSYRQVVTEDAELLMHWRSKPDVSRYMATEFEANLEHQKVWLHARGADEHYHHRIIQIHGNDVGYCSITVTDPRSRIGELGVYIGDETAPRELTIYNFLGTHNHAFFSLGLHKIVNHIMTDNARTLQLQKFNGYREVGVLKEHWRRSERWCDVHIFEMTAQRWYDFRTKFDYNKDWDGQHTMPSSLGSEER